MLINLRPSIGPVLVVGGGVVASRKVARLVQEGFRVTVVAPSILPALRNLPGVALVERGFIDGDLAGHAVVITCANVREVNRRAGERARAAGLPVCVCDAPDECTFWGVASLRRRRLTLGVGTDTGRPRLASRALRKLRRLWPRAR